jgi:hypothetical protein
MRTQRGDENRQKPFWVTQHKQPVERIQHYFTIIMRIVIPAPHHVRGKLQRESS